MIVLLKYDSDCRRVVLWGNFICHAGWCISFWGPWRTKKLPQNDTCNSPLSFPLNGKLMEIIWLICLDIVCRGYWMSSTQFLTMFIYLLSAVIWYQGSLLLTLHRSISFYCFKCSCLIICLTSLKRIGFLIRSRPVLSYIFHFKRWVKALIF